jgi:AcrR family transcriptional regulator
LTRGLAKADVGFGSFYNHFSTKSEPFEAAVADVLEELGELFDRLSVDVEEAATAFAQSVRLMLRLCRSHPQISAVLVREGMHYMEWSPRAGWRAPAARHPGGRGIGPVPQGEPRLARAAVSGAVLATLPMSLTNPELVDDAACDQLVEQLLRMLGVPFEAARELAHAPLRSRSCPNPADLRDPSAHTGQQPTGGRVRPPPSSPLDAVQGLALRRRARRDDGNASASLDDRPGPVG